MKFRRHIANPRKGAPGWMVTFSDLITLVLVFFILLFSMSQIDMIKFRAVSDSLRDNAFLDFYPSIIPFENPDGDITNMPQKNDDEGQANESETGEQEPLYQLLAEIETFLDANGMDDVIIANRAERGVVLVLSEKVLFNPGEAVLLEDSFLFLDKVGDLLAKLPNLVKVEGHTDDVPMNSFRYPSNWELSAARSSSVIKYIIENHQLDSTRFIAVGYADTRPTVPNESAENRKKNRRVEIVISDPKFSENDNISK